MLNEEQIGKTVDSLNIENRILMNDLIVMNAIVKSILGLETQEIDGVEYIKADDIVNICTEGFKSLSSKLKNKKKKKE